MSALSDEEIKKWKITLGIAGILFVLSVILSSYKSYSIRSKEEKTAEFYQKNATFLESGAKAAVEDYYSALKKGDFDAALKYVSSSRGQSHATSLKACQASYECVIPLKYSIFEISEGKISRNGRISINVKNYYPDITAVKKKAYNDLEKEGKNQGLGLWEIDKFIRDNMEKKTAELLRNSDYPAMERTYTVFVFSEPDGYKITF